MIQITLQNAQGVTILQYLLRCRLLWNTHLGCEFGGGGNKTCKILIYGEFWWIQKKSSFRRCLEKLWPCMLTVLYLTPLPLVPGQYQSFCCNWYAAVSPAGCSYSRKCFRMAIFNSCDTLEVNVTSLLVLRASATAAEESAGGGGEEDFHVAVLYTCMTRGFHDIP